MSPIRPKAVDGVVVHHPRVAKTPAIRRPRKVELSESLIREQEDVYTTSTSYDEEGDVLSTRQNFVTKLRSHYEESAISDVTMSHCIVATIAGLFLLFFTGYKGTATVTLYPKEYTKTVTIPSSSFEQKEMVITESLSQKITSQTLADVQEKATGVVTMVNEESTAQKFRAATRLESSTGKIYFMENKEVLVPAKVGDKPGTLDVTITAEKAGPEYNIEKTDFVVPGWKETGNPKFTTQYAHSKTAIAGGFIGKKPTIDPVEKDRVITVLKQGLSKRVEERAGREIPDLWFVLSEGQLTYGEPTITTVAEGQAELTQTATKTFKIVNRIDVGKFVAKQEAGLEQYTVVATNTDKLSFDGTKLEGTVTAKPLVPEALYKQKLLGQKLRSVKKLYPALPELSGMEIKVTPFWKRALPSDPGKITIKS